MKNVNEILDKLEELYPDAQCELEHTTAFELLIATILSAQCTDVRVNIVTRELFKKYNKPEDFANLSEEEIMKEIKTALAAPQLWRNKWLKPRTLHRPRARPDALSASSALSSTLSFRRIKCRRSTTP